METPSPSQNANARSTSTKPRHSGPAGLTPGAAQLLASDDIVILPCATNKHETRAQILLSLASWRVGLGEIWPCPRDTPATHDAVLGAVLRTLAIGMDDPVRRAFLAAFRPSHVRDVYAFLMYGGVERYCRGVEARVMEELEAARMAVLEATARTDGAVVPVWDCTGSAERLGQLKKGMYRTMMWTIDQDPDHQMPSGEEWCCGDISDVETSWWEIMSDICDEVSALREQDTTTPDPRPRKKQETSKGQASTTELSIEESPRARKKTSPPGDGSSDGTMRAENRTTGKERAETLREPPFTSAHVKNCDMPGLEPIVARQEPPHEVNVGPSRGARVVIIEDEDEDGAVPISVGDDVLSSTDQTDTPDTKELGDIPGLEPSVARRGSPHEVDIGPSRGARVVIIKDEDEDGAAPVSTEYDVFSLTDETDTLDTTELLGVDGPPIGNDNSTVETDENQARSPIGSDEAMIDENKSNNINDDLLSHRAGPSQPNTSPSPSSPSAPQDPPLPTNDPVALRRQLIILLHQQTEAIRQTHERHEAQRTADRAVLKSQLARHDAARAREHDSMERAFHETRELVSRFMP